MIDLVCGIKVVIYAVIDKALSVSYLCLDCVIITSAHVFETPLFYFDQVENMENS